MTIPGAATTSCLKRALWNVLSSVTYSPGHRHNGAPMTNRPSTLRTATDLCKNVVLAVLFGNNGNSCRVSMHSDVWMYTRVVHNTRRWSGKRNIKEMV